MQYSEPVPQFIILGYNDPEFVPLDPAEDDLLDEAHQSYMDSVVDRLRARGPMLTANHNGHTGNLHILEASSGEEVSTFVLNEPYNVAGLFARVEIFNFEPWLTESMWERIGDRNSARSWLAVWRSSSPSTPTLNPHPTIPNAVLSIGRITDLRDNSFAGVVAMFDASDASAPGLVEALAQLTNIKTSTFSMTPWRRGGRS